MCKFNCMSTSFYFLVTIFIADQQIQQRRVVKPSKSPISSGSKSSHSLSSKSNRFVKTPMVVTANECHYLPKLSNNKATSTESLLTKQRCNKYVWVNKNLLSQNNSKSCTIPTDAVVASTSISNQKSPLLSPKQTVTARNTEKLLQPVGKYKLVKKRLSWSNRSKPTNKARFSPHLSKSGKRIISKYKIRRRSADSKKSHGKFSSHGSSPLLKTRKYSSPFKVDHRKPATKTHNRYKIDKISATRKPIRILSLRKKPHRRSLKWVRSDLRSSYTFMSPHKLVSRTTTTITGGKFFISSCEIDV